MDRDALSYYLYRLAGVIAPRVPPRIGYRAAEQIGAMVYRRSGARAIVEDNISHIVGEPADSPRVRHIARQVFRNQLKNYFDLLRVATLTPDDIRHAIREVHGLENLQSALSRGHGVVLASAHFGNIDLAAQILALYGFRVTAVAEHLRPERLFEYVRGIRASHGLRFIPIDQSLRPVFRALKANEIVGLALDRNVTDPGRLVPFFGQPARLPDGYLKLALHTQAALVLAFCRRLTDDRFAITIEPEVELVRSGDPEQNMMTNMRRVLAIFERYLSRNPEQWVYFQRVWSPYNGNSFRA